MTLALALAFLAAPQAASPASVDTLQIAMTRGGVRLEVSAKPAPGSREVKTAFGVFHTPLDPVALVMESPRRARWRGELEANPELSLMPTIAALNADGRIAELIEMIPVLEARLLEDELSSKAEHRRDELIAASNAIAGWGELLDPLPGELSREERVLALWKRARSAEGASALLSGGRLLFEVTPGGAGIGEHQLNISQLREGMRSRNPYLRRVASQISGKQLIFDSSQNALILMASMEDKHVVARDGAADGIVRVWPGQAREYWTDILLRWEDEYRGRAGWHLVDHLPREAAAPVVGTVAASGERVSRRFDVGDITLTVVSERRKPSKFFAGSGTNNPNRGGSTAAAAASAADECSSTGVGFTGGAANGVTPGVGRVPRGLTNGSTAKVTKVNVALTESLKRALQRLADDGEERDREAWIAWYEELLKKETSNQP
jgi:hypothetical protein